MNPDLVYKILPRGEWKEALERGQFEGSGIDLNDGFIHLSSASQYHETLQKHFAGQDDLVRLGIAPESLGSTLKWEVSRGGDLFPHVYGPIPTTIVAEVHEIQRSSS